MYKFLVLVSFFLVKNGFTQTSQIDSLKLRLKKEKSEDTVRVNDLNELAWQYLDYSTDSSGKYADQALQLSEQIHFLNGSIDAKNVQGILYRYASESEKAIRLYEEIIRLRTEQGRLERLTGAYSNFGSVYFEKGDYTSALRYYQKAFDNATKFKQTENQMVLLNNIGTSYKMLGLVDQAIEAFKKGLQLNKSIKNEIQDAMLYLNIATVYTQQGFYKEAYEYENYGYAIFKKTNNIRQLSIILYNLSVSTRQIKDLKATEKVINEMKGIADVLKEDDYYATFYQARASYYIATAKYPEALKDIVFSLKLTDTISDVSSYCERLRIKSEVYLKMHEYDKAVYYCDKVSTMVHKQNNKYELVNNHKIRAEIYESKGDYKSALHYYGLAQNLKDSLNTETFKTKMAVLHSINELDKKESQLQLSIKEKETMAIQNKQQSALLIGSMVIGLLVLILLIFSIRAYRDKKKDNELLNNQKEEIQLKNSALQERQIEIEKQKYLVEEKQKEILDSIHYARRIQNTLMANRELIDRNLRENFIVFKPKDIVSGDFYWVTEKEDRFYLAICDSTGHGVPGAFMSLLNISFLNEAINEKNIQEPNQVLNHVRQKLIGSVSQDGSQDGMDCILLCFYRQQNLITYAAAQNRLLLIRNGETLELPSDKMPVGKGESQESFTLHTITPEKGDQLYLYSDGFADQFGGPKGKKFKYRSLHEHLLKNSQLSMPEQAKVMETIFENWKGHLEQVDDVVLMGIRL